MPCFSFFLRHFARYTILGGFSFNTWIFFFLFFVVSIITDAKSVAGKIVIALQVTFSVWLLLRCFLFVSSDLQIHCNMSSCGCLSYSGLAKLCLFCLWILLFCQFQEILSCRLIITTLLIALFFFITLSRYLLEHLILYSISLTFSFLFSIYLFLWVAFLIIYSDLPFSLYILSPLVSVSNCNIFIPTYSVWAFSPSQNFQGFL